MEETIRAVNCIILLEIKACIGTGLIFSPRRERDATSSTKTLVCLPRVCFDHSNTYLAVLVVRFRQVLTFDAVVFIPA